MKDREKQIQEMAKSIFESGVALDGIDFAFGVDGDDNFTRLAQRLINTGYGNVKKAVKEFAEKLKQIICDCTVPDFNKSGKPISRFIIDGYKRIDEIVKEVCN